MTSPPPDLIRRTDAGLYCEAGGFHIDPWKPVERALITHAHSDHARRGSASYLCLDACRDLLAARVGAGATIETIEKGTELQLGECRVSFHPAGHILGSAQIRVAHPKLGTWVVSGDYNTHPCNACDAFEPVACDVFITESTFGLPIYNWPDEADVFADIHRWWTDCQAKGMTCVLPAYPLGKSQRLLAGLNSDVGPIGVHGNVKTFLPLYEKAGIRLARSVPLDETTVTELKGRGLVITSSAAQETGLLKKLGKISWAFASGWMQTRAARRNRDYDRGFILSDHADWNGLLGAIRATGAGRIGVTHGQVEAFSRYLREQGYDAFPIRTHFEGTEEGD